MIIEKLKCCELNVHVIFEEVFVMFSYIRYIFRLRQLFFNLPFCAFDLSTVETLLRLSALVVASELRAFKSCVLAWSMALSEVRSLFISEMSCTVMQLKMR